MFFVYILESDKNHKYYIGCTENFEDRLKKHNSGRVKSTKPHRPWSLRNVEKYNKLSEARTREKQIKSWKSREAIERLLHGPIV